MFGALNRFIARLDAEPSTQAGLQPNNSHAASLGGGGAGDSSYGFQVLRNTNSDIPLEPWFDFVVGINGHGIESSDYTLFVAEIGNCKGGLCSLDVWSAKGQRMHTITITVPATGEGLGISFQLAPLSSTQHIWHILEIVSPLSPAHKAGLLPHSDYILGSPSGTLRGEIALGELVEDHLDRSLVLWIYNSEFDVVREVELIPTRGWGGEGALGAVLGYGALHRLPVGIGEEVQAPGEKLFEAERTSAEYPGQSEMSPFIQPPVQSQSPAPPPPAVNIAPPPMLDPHAAIPMKSAAKKKPRRVVPGFDDMFAEGAKKSAEQDFVPSRKGTPIAPPPARRGSTVSNTTTEDHTKPGDDLGEPGEAEIT